jgi:hypothetical protein
MFTKHWAAMMLDLPPAMVREIWIHVNGRRVFADKNLYYPASGRKPPLQAGPNEIAIGDDLGSQRHRGVEFRLDERPGM